MRTLPLTIIPAFAGALGFSGGASAQDLQAAEIGRARTYLEQTRDAVIAATQGLSEAQWKFKPAPDRWSIAEIVEHIVDTQELILGPIRQQLAASPAPPDGRDYREVDSVVLAKLPDRSKRFKAPDVLQPSGKMTEAAAIERLRQDTAGLIEYLDSTPDLRHHILDAPPLAAISDGRYTTMDGYQWILGAAGHAERHTAQLLEVKADARFPAK